MNEQSGWSRPLVVPNDTSRPHKRRVFNKTEQGCLAPKWKVASYTEDCGYERRLEIWDLE